MTGITNLQRCANYSEETIEIIPTLRGCLWVYRMWAYHQIESFHNGGAVLVEVVHNRVAFSWCYSAVVARILREAVDRKLQEWSDDDHGPSFRSID
jgi:hypothetical protein